MNVRTSAALLAISLGLVTFPAWSQERGTFSAWGHQFLIPGEQTHSFGGTASADAEIGPTRRVGTPNAYTSIGSGRAVTPPSTELPAQRTINVWGARIDMPAY